MRREQLVAVLDAVCVAAATKAAAPAFESVWFDGQHALAYDGELAVRVPCELKLRGGVSAHALRTWAQGCAGSDVVAEIEKGAQFRCGRSRLSLPLLGLDQAEAVVPKEIVAGRAKDALVVADQAALRDALARCSKFADTDAAHPARAGVTLVAGTKRLRLWASDNLTLTRQFLDGKGSMQVVMPNRWLDATAKLGAIAVLDAGDGWVRATCTAEVGEVVVFSRATDENSVEEFQQTVQQVIADQEGHPLPPKVLEAAAQVAKTVKAIGGEWCELAIKDGVLRISATGTRGTVKQSVKVGHPDARAMVVASELLRVLDGCDKWLVCDVAVVAWGDRVVNLVSASDSE